MICFRKLLKNQGQMMISTYKNETFLSFHPFLADFETFWSPRPRGQFRLSDERDKRKRYKSSRICDICLMASDSLWRDMPRTARREDLYSRTIHHIRQRRIYRYLAPRDNIAFARQIYRAPKVHIA